MCKVLNISRSTYYTYKEKQIKKYRAKKYNTNNSKEVNIVNREFDTNEQNEVIVSDLLKEFNITHSLSTKGCPYDNAVAEATFKIIKTEFVYLRTFESLEQLDTNLKSYFYWFNNKRIHGSLGYMSPVDYKNSLLQKIV